MNAENLIPQSLLMAQPGVPPTHRSGTICWPCPLKAITNCPWHHDEQPGLEDAPSLVLPADWFQNRDAVALNESITAAANRASRDRTARVELALQDHLGAHSLLEWVQALAAMTDDRDRWKRQALEIGAAAGSLYQEPALYAAMQSVPLNLSDFSGGGR